MSEGWRNFKKIITLGAGLGAAEVLPVSPAHAAEKPAGIERIQGAGEELQWQTPGRRTYNEDGTIATEDYHGMAGERAPRPDMTPEQLQTVLENMTSMSRNALKRYDESYDETARDIARKQEEFLQNFPPEERADVISPQQIGDSLKEASSALRKSTEAYDAASRQYSASRSEADRVRMNELLKTLTDDYSSFEALSHDLGVLFEAEEIEAATKAQEEKERRRVPKRNKPIS